MLKETTMSETAGPVMAGALLVALLWALVELAPTAAQRWFGF